MPPAMGGGPHASAPPKPQAPIPPEPPSEKDQLEKKIAALEKRVQEEREKVLLSDLKTQQESANAARVEVSIKELQDKLRRDRREQEQEEARLKMEAKTTELEVRLAQERETWVSTLKSQMMTRESQDREMESHFTLRIQEMERRWLEEKAHWQKTLLAKDEENRNLRNLAEKLKGVEVEYARVNLEKKGYENKVLELSQERSETQGRLQNALEKEKELITLRAELSMASRDLQAERLTSHERQERFLADSERLKRDLDTVAGRLRADHDAEIARLKAAHETELGRLKESETRSHEENTRLRAVSGALERQLAASRSQLEGFKGAAGQWAKAQDRYKAEFMVLQRRWADREKEIRQETEAQAAQRFELEKAKIQQKLQEEMSHREAIMADEMRVERDRQRLERERTKPESAKILETLRAEYETGRTQTKAKFESAVRDLRLKQDELQARLHGAEESSRLLAEEKLQLVSELRARQEELSRMNMSLSHAQGQETHAVEESSRLARETAESQRHLQSVLEEVGKLKAMLADVSATAASESDAHTHIAIEKAALERLMEVRKKEVDDLNAALSGAAQQAARDEIQRAGMALEKINIERLAMAQAAEIKELQEGLSSMREQLISQAGAARHYLGQKEQLESAYTMQLKALEELKLKTQSQPEVKIEPKPELPPTP